MRNLFLLPLIYCPRPFNSPLYSDCFLWAAMFKRMLACSTFSVLAMYVPVLMWDKVARSESLRIAKKPVLTIHRIEGKNNLIFIALSITLSALGNPDSLIQSEKRCIGEFWIAFIFWHTLFQHSQGQLINFDLYSSWEIMTLNHLVEALWNILVRFPDGTRLRCKVSPIGTWRCRG